MEEKIFADVTNSLRMTSSRSREITWKETSNKKEDKKNHQQGHYYDVIEKSEIKATASQQVFDDVIKSAPTQYCDVIDSIVTSQFVRRRSFVLCRSLLVVVL